MKQKLLVQREKRKESNEITDSSIFDLFYEKNGDAVVLQYSPLDKSWTQPGKNAAKLKSDGDGFDVEISSGPGKDKQLIRLDYSAADYLRILLSVHSKLYKKNKRSHYISEEKIVGNVKDLDVKAAKKGLRKMGDIVSDLQKVVSEMVKDHGLSEKVIRTLLEEAKK
jgi:hypothetical protein